MASRFEVLRGRGGRWLVRDGHRRFSVPPDLGARLQGPDGPRRWRGLLAGHAADTAPRRPRRGLWLRLPLVPGALVRRTARGLARLTSTAWLAGMSVGGLTALIVAPQAPAGGDVGWPWVLAVFLLTAVVHELGHAAALSREGWPPGGIGLGLLWVLPVCWCDVSAVALLPRRGRVRVDLAGTAFQLAAAGLIALVSGMLAEPAGSLGARLAVAAAFWSVLPIARTDGYWLACDLLDLPDLETPLDAGATRGRRIAAAVWRIFTALSLAALAGLLVWRLHGWFGGAAPGPSWLGVLGRGVVGSVVLVGLLRSLQRIVRLLAASRHDLWS